MRNLLLLLAMVWIVTACSNDDSDAPVDDGKKYEVKFGVKNQLFTVEERSLRNWTDDTRLCQLVAYKESGEVYTSKVLFKEDIEQVGSATELPMSLELPKGNYHIAIVSSFYNPMHPQYYQINPKNYNTDYYSNSSVSSSTNNNVGVYYETFDITVTGTMTNSQEVILKPMWASIELVIEDIQNIIAPADTKYIDFRLSPIYSGFSVKTKLPEASPGNALVNPLGVIRMDAFPSDDQITFKPIVAATGDLQVSVTVNCLAADGLTILYSKELAKTNLKNATHYKVSGKLGNISEEASGKFSIKLGDFTGEIIDVPFL